MTQAPPGRRTSYDEVPYASFPFRQTHPERMAVVARLFALDPPALGGCRVLELGCAGGGNLIPMAVAMPEATFVGVDLSAVQVAEGAALAQALKLANVGLFAMGIEEVGTGRFGTFDYILCHGVYSWVPDRVQEKILSICATQLAPDGVAYVSYNTLPGWRMRGMIRDLMRYHAMTFEEPAQRVAQARAILDFLAKWVPTANNAYGMLLKNELEGLRRQPDYYILHEHLEETNEPAYFHEFAARAARHGLQYLGEAEFSTMLASNFPPEAGETVRRIGRDVIRQEQFMDFLRNRTFRQTLLVHDGLAVDRNVTPARLTTLWVAARLQPVNGSPDLAVSAEASFQAPGGGMLKTRNPVTKAAMLILANHWPAALSFGDLLRTALAYPGMPDPAAASVNTDPEPILASDLLQCYAAGLIDLHAQPPAFVTRAGERPLASPLARWQAAKGLTGLTSLRHEVVRVDQNVARLLQLLDGSRDRDTLCHALAGGAAEPARDKVDQAIEQLARSALLVG